jgi:aminoglycoside phosphotransferase (APT) family kinase protein
VPAVLGSGTDGDVGWLPLNGLAGRDATAPQLRSRPEWTVPVLARGLRRFHETPIEACPFRLTIDSALNTVRQRVAEGRADHGDLHPEFSHLSLDEAVRRLEELAPTGEDLVVCHGDYCFPNVLIDGDQVAAYLDLGELAGGRPLVGPGRGLVEHHLERRPRLRAALFRRLRDRPRSPTDVLLPPALRPHLIGLSGSVPTSMTTAAGNAIGTLAQLSHAPLADPRRRRRRARRVPWPGRN